MVQMTPTLEQKLKSNQAAQVKLVIWTTHSPAQYTARLQAQGFQVLHSSKLINAVTVEGQANAALALGAQTWVACIEEYKEPSKPASAARK
jgi:hypothetical protein